MIALLLCLVSAFAGVVQPSSSPEALDSVYKPRRVALIVGVQDYEDPQLQGLKFAEKDALELHRALKDPTIGGFDQAFVLTGNKNTLRQEIVNALAWATAELQRDDTFLLYMSGHGTLTLDAVEGSKLYFLPSDGELDRPKQTGISVSWLEEQVNSLPSRRRVLILDTCHNGRGGKSVVSSPTAQLLAGMRGAPPAPRALREVSESEARLYAAQYYQPALEDPNLGNGVYTHFLLKALTEQQEAADLDRDGLVDVAELHEYARDRTIRHTGGIQVPRAEYRIVGHEEIYLAGDPAARRTAEKALISACDEILARAKLLVDGIPRGEFPGLLALDPGRHDLELQTEDGRTLLRRSINLTAGTTVPIEHLIEDREPRWLLIGGPVFRHGEATSTYAARAAGELEVAWVQPFRTPHWLRPELHLRSGLARGPVPDSSEATVTEWETAGGTSIGLRAGPLSLGPSLEFGWRSRLGSEDEGSRDVPAQAGAIVAGGLRGLAIFETNSTDIALRYDVRLSSQQYAQSTATLWHHGVGLGAAF